jgi:hypothetical protein
LLLIEKGFSYSDAEAMPSDERRAFCKLIMERNQPAGAGGIESLLSGVE